jgi:hypothetical protein
VAGGDGQDDGAGAAAGAGAGAGGGSTGDGTGSGSGASAGSDGGAASTGSEGGSGLDARLVADVPLTRFDFLAFAIAIGVLIGTALVLRRLSHSPRVEA